MIICNIVGHAVYMLPLPAWLEWWKHVRAHTHTQSVRGVLVACFVPCISAWPHHLGVDPRRSGLDILHPSVLHLWALVPVFLSSCRVKGAALRTQGDAQSDDWGGGKQLQTFYLYFATLKKINGASLVAQWLRVHLPMQGTWVRALVREDPTCRGVTKLGRHNYWACALETTSHNYWVCVPQLLKPTCLEPVLRNKRSHCNEKPRTATKIQRSQK